MFAQAVLAHHKTNSYLGYVYDLVTSYIQGEM